MSDDETNSKCVFSKTHSVNANALGRIAARWGIIVAIMLQMAWGLRWGNMSLPRSSQTMKLIRIYEQNPSVENRHAVSDSAIHDASIHQQWNYVRLGVMLAFD